MSWLSGIIELVNKVLDRFPSRTESILNRIQEIKHELKTMQLDKAGQWTEADTIKYNTLLIELSQLEQRASNFGK